MPRSNVSKTFVWALAAFLLIPAIAAADQETETLPGRISEEVDVSLVSIYASVRDSKDHPVKGLNKEDFILTNDGRPLEASTFSGDPTEPGTLAFLLDTSGSMRVSDKYGIAEKLIDAILEKLQQDDDATLIVFGDEKVNTVVDLTKDRAAISNAVAAQKLWGPTALWDAIVFSQKLVLENYGKKAVILISDGFDNRSENVFKRAVDEASKVLLPVYVCEISLPEEDEMREVNFDSPLQKFAEATGGLHFTVQSDETKEIRKVAERVVEEIRYQYYFGVPGGSLGPSPRIELKTARGPYRIRLQHSLNH